jgi:hypothetical protein
LHKIEPDLPNSRGIQTPTLRGRSARTGVRACVVAGAPLSLSLDEGLFGFASLPYLQIFSIFTFPKEFFFFLFCVLIFSTFSFLFLAVF